MTPKRVEWKAVFIEALSKSANVLASCKAAGITRQTAYKHKREDRGFSELWDNAIQHAVDTLEAVAWQRARNQADPGSTTLLIFLLKAHRPSLYRETYRHELTGADGGPIVSVNESELDREIKQLVGELAARSEDSTEKRADA